MILFLIFHFVKDGKLENHVTIHNFLNISPYIKKTLCDDLQEDERIF